MYNYSAVYHRTNEFIKIGYRTTCITKDATEKLFSVIIYITIEENHF